MQQSVIAILILGTALVLYMIPKIPLTVTTMLAVLAMVFTGVLSVEQAFSGFSNNTTLFVAGMLIIGQACFTTGLVKKMSTVLCRFVGVSEKTLAMVIFILSAVLGVFLNGAIIVSLLMTAIDCIAANSNGKYQRKNLYFPLGMGATVGNNMTTISGTSTITALAIYYAVGYETVPLFEPLLVNLPAFIVALLFFFLNGYRLSVKTFDFEDENAAQQTVKNDKAEYITWKIVLTSIVLVMVIVALIAGCNYGVCSVLGAAVLILTGCIGEKEAFSGINWTTIIIVAGSIGISIGVAESGAAEIFANAILNAFACVADSPYILCIVIMFASSLISNVMSDNAAAAIFTPIAIGFALSLHTNPLPFVLAAAYGVKDAIASPLSVATMTMLQPTGYRFKDYVVVGGSINLIMLVVSAIMLKIVYFM